MKPHICEKLSIAAFAVAVSSIPLSAGSFQEVAERLDLDGTFVGYMDFDGDGQEIGEKLNVIYQQFAEANPSVPPFPLDFPAIFETLGFGSIKSMGMSSVEVEGSLFRNRSVTLLDGEPAGLFAMYGLEPIPFRAAELAPANATTVMSGRLNLNALTTTANTLASQVMGPMGEGMVMQGLSQPVPGTDVTVSELVSALSNGMDLIMYQSFENMQQPDLKLWVSLKGAGSLISRVEPMLTQMGIQIVDTGGGKLADLSPMMQGAPFGLFIEAPAGSDELLVYTDADWVASFGSGSNLASSESYKRVAGELPKDASFYTYSSGLDVTQLMTIMEANPETAAFAPVIANAVDSLFGGFLAPSASATYRDGDALITESYAGFSYKGLLMALPAGIGAGVGAGIAAQQAAQANADAQSDEEPMWEDHVSEPDE